jgi:hypothetical protein
MGEGMRGLWRLMWGGNELSCDPEVFVHSDTVICFSGDVFRNGTVNMSKSVRGIHDRGISCPRAKLRRALR